MSVCSVFLSLNNLHIDKPVALLDSLQYIRPMRWRVLLCSRPCQVGFAWHLDGIMFELQKSNISQSDIISSVMPLAVRNPIMGNKYLLRIVLIEKISFVFVTSKLDAFWRKISIPRYYLRRQSGRGNVFGSVCLFVCKLVCLFGGLLIRLSRR